MVNQILLLSRTSPELFHLQLGRVDAFEVAQKVITDLYSKVEFKEQEISLEGESTRIHSTEFTLYTLLSNLVANAISYSPVHAVIQITVRQQGNSAELLVEDSGPGIAEEEREKVLERFYRDQKQEARQTNGSGLGLAIVRQILMLHQGTIELGTSGLGGLKVRVQLPLNEVSL